MLFQNLDSSASRCKPGKLQKLSHFSELMILVSFQHCCIKMSPYIKEEISKCVLDRTKKKDQENVFRKEGPPIYINNLGRRDMLEKNNDCTAQADCHGKKIQGRYLERLGFGKAQRICGDMKSCVLCSFISPFLSLPNFLCSFLPSPSFLPSLLRAYYN